MPIRPQTMDPRSFPDAPNSPPPPPVRVRDATVSLDRLSGRERGLRFFSTGAFTTGVVGLQAFGLVNGTAFRCTQITFQMTENAAISGGAAEATIKILSNGVPTGLEVAFFVPAASVAGIGVEIVGPWFLDRGYVFDEGTPTVSVDQTLTSGHFRVILGGYLDVPVAQS